MTSLFKWRVVRYVILILPPVALSLYIYICKICNNNRAVFLRVSAIFPKKFFPNFSNRHANHLQFDKAYPISLIHPSFLYKNISTHNIYDLLTHNKIKLNRATWELNFGFFFLNLYIVQTPITKKKKKNCKNK